MAEAETGFQTSSVEFLEAYSGSDQAVPRRAWVRGSRGDSGPRIGVPSTGWRFRNDGIS
jgi:hypothetical protein